MGNMITTTNFDREVAQQRTSGSRNSQHGKRLKFDAQGAVVKLQNALIKHSKVYPPPN